MEKLRQALCELGAPHDDKTINKLTAVMDMVLEKNEVINLTTITDRDDFVLKHIIDSLMCYGWEEIESSKDIVDIGTGAGFPGLPLAIVYPEKRFTLADSLNKRTEFINTVINELDIKNANTVHSRAEDLGRSKDFREKFDLCVSRAVAKLSVLSEYCLPLIKKDGWFYAYKTKMALGEIEESELARNLLGAERKVEVRETSLKDFHLDHNIIIMKKNRNTPKSYPRKAGTPNKVPL